QRSLDSLQPRDRDLLVDAARESVKVMRELWDASEAEARRAVAEAGVQFNDVDSAAFRAAARPLVDEFLGDAAIADIDRRIRAAAWRRAVTHATAAPDAPPPSALDRVSDASISVAVVALLGLVVVQGWQVFARYVVNDSPSWTEPVTIVLLAAAMSFGAAS